MHRIRRMTRVPALLLLLCAWLAPVAAGAAEADGARAVLYESAPGKLGVAVNGTVDWRLAGEDAPNGLRIEARTVRREPAASGHTGCKRPPPPSPRRRHSARRSYTLPIHRHVGRRGW